MVVDNQSYTIQFAETAIKDMTDKADDFAHQFRDSSLALSWFQNLNHYISKQMAFFPYKYPIYHFSSEIRSEIRFFTYKNDIVFYSVNEEQKAVIVRLIATKSQDLLQKLNHSL